MIHADGPLAATPPPALSGERVAFTGTLASMTHQQAAEVVSRSGGEAAPHVSRQTTLLVVGEEGWPLDPDGRASLKFRQVAELRAAGAMIRVLRESDWLHLLGLSERRDDVHRLYTPAMLGTMLDLPVPLVRRWEQVGLLRAAKRVCRLPYFDFQEVARLRRLAELLAEGVPRDELESSLAALAELFPEAAQPRATLDLLARGNRVYLRDGRGLVEPSSGQRVFDFDAEAEADDGDEPVSLPLPLPPDDAVPVRSTSAGEWFGRGCELLEQGRFGPAVAAFRASLTLRPEDAETQFCLADALYRSGDPAAALERCYAVVETDRRYLEAWNQVGCLHAERGEHDSAIAAFRTALGLHPDYPDAHLHLAASLHAVDRSAEAADHWRTYLRFDRRGPWADLARQRLGIDDDA